MGAGSLAPGQVVDRYEVVRPLGEGGMARVYLVRHATLGTFHALKLLTTTSPQVADRLLREGRIQGQLRDPGVVTVTDVVSVDGAPGLVMEFVDGPTLHDLIARLRPTVAQADALAREILRVMSAAHRAGLVHRDLKPANILIEVGHATLQPKIADFGLAKLLGGDAPLGATRSGVMMGTPQYMAPEQFRDAARVDARADVFSLGAILFELVTGEKAFGGRDLVDVLAAVGAADAVDPRARVPDLPDRMVEAIRGCLKSRADDRWPEAGAALAAWTRGAPDPLSRSWSDDERAAVRSLSAPAPTGPSDDQPTLSVPGRVAATPAPSPPPPSASPAPAPSAPSLAPIAPDRTPARGRWWIPAGVLVLVLGVGAPATWLGTRPPDRPGAIVVSDDPLVQQKLDQAWALIHAGDPARASTLAEEVVAAEPESAWALYTLGWTLGPGAMATFERAAALATSDRPEDRLVKLAWWALDGRAEPADWEAFETQHPELPLALLARARDPRLKPDDRTRLLVRANEALPESVWPLAQLHIEAVRQGDVDAAQRWLDEAALRFPLSPEVLWRQCYAALVAGDFDREHALAMRGLALSPNHPSLRWHRVVAGLHTGADPATRAELDRLVSEGRPAERASHAATLAGYPFGVGQLRLADELLATCRELTSATEAAAERAMCDSIALDLSMTLDDPVKVQAATDVLLRDMADPAIPSAVRTRYAPVVLLSEGLTRLHAGDLAGSEGVASRLAALAADQGGGSETRSTWIALKAHLAEARGAADPDVIAHLDEVETSWPAMGRYTRATHLLALGDREAAITGYREVVSGRLRSSHSAQQRYAEADSAVSLAELVADTDPEEARGALGLFDHLWLQADPDHPLVLRAAEVRSRLPPAP